MKKKEFALEQQPTDYVISVHMQNLFATFGEDKVRAVMKDLFGAVSTKRKIKKIS